MRGAVKKRLVARLLPDRQNRSGAQHLERWIADLAAGLPSGATVLDAGSGAAPYRELFTHTTFETADHTKSQPLASYHPPTYVCDLSSIPADAGRFDLVICTQVLEHVPDPGAVLRELARVLRPGGVLALSAPLMYEEHETPYDFYRYTQFGLTHLATDAGFVVEDLQRLEGYYGALAHQLATASTDLSLREVARGAPMARRVPLIAALVLTRPLFAVLARVFSSMDQTIAPAASSGPCLNYRAELRKPGAAQTQR